MELNSDNMNHFSNSETTPNGTTKFTNGSCINKKFSKAGGIKATKRTTFNLNPAEEQEFQDDLDSRQLYQASSHKGANNFEYYHPSHVILHGSDVDAKQFHQELDEHRVEPVMNGGRVHGSSDRILEEEEEDEEGGFFPIDDNPYFQKPSMYTRSIDRREAFRDPYRYHSHQEELRRNHCDATLSRRYLASRRQRLGGQVAAPPDDTWLV